MEVVVERIVLAKVIIGNIDEMQVWREIDLKITRYHVEAVDNAKFLGAIERSSHAIYLEDPANMKQPLMRLLHIVKMIYNVSTFYNTPERVCNGNGTRGTHTIKHEG